MSLNVFCSCGASGGAIHINLPDHLCLLDKTWHTGFDFPLAFKICPPWKAVTDEFSCDNSSVNQRRLLSSLNIGASYARWVLLSVDLSRIYNVEQIFANNKRERGFHSNANFLFSENWTHALVSPQPILRHSSLFFSLLFCLLSSP